MEGLADYPCDDVRVPFEGISACAEFQGTRMFGAAHKGRTDVQVNH